MFEPDNTIEIKQIKAHNHLNDIISMNRKIPQKIGVMYNVAQKIFESMFDSLFSCSDSYIHSSVPSSLTSFHHLNPTKNRPDIFLTYQKSNAEKMTISIKDNDSPIILENSRNLEYK
jgi:hypothetical protein